MVWDWVELKNASEYLYALGKALSRDPKKSHVRDSDLCVGHRDKSHSTLHFLCSYFLTNTSVIRYYALSYVLIIVSICLSPYTSNTPPETYFFRSDLTFQDDSEQLKRLRKILIWVLGGCHVNSIFGKRRGLSGPRKTGLLHPLADVSSGSTPWWSMTPSNGFIPSVLLGFYQCAKYFIDWPWLNVEDYLRCDVVSSSQHAAL